MLLFVFLHLFLYVSDATSRGNSSLLLVEGGSEEPIGSRQFVAEKRRRRHYRKPKRGHELTPASLIIAPIEGQRVYTKETFDIADKDVRDRALDDFYDRILVSEAKGSLEEVLDPVFVTSPPPRTTVAVDGIEDTPLVTPKPIRQYDQSETTTSDHRDGMRKTLKLVTLPKNADVTAAPVIAPANNDMERPRIRNYLAAKSDVRAMDDSPRRPRNRGREASNSPSLHAMTPLYDAIPTVAPMQAWTPLPLIEDLIPPEFPPSDQLPGVLRAPGLIEQVPAPILAPAQQQAQQFIRFPLQQWQIPPQLQYQRSTNVNPAAYSPYIPPTTQSSSVSYQGFYEHAYPDMENFHQKQSGWQGQSPQYQLQMQVPPLSPSFQHQEPQSQQFYQQTAQFSPQRNKNGQNGFDRTNFGSSRGGARFAKTMELQAIPLPQQADQYTNRARTFQQKQIEKKEERRDFHGFEQQFSVDSNPYQQQVSRDGAPTDQEQLRQFVNKYPEMEKLAEKISDGPIIPVNKYQTYASGSDTKSYSGLNPNQKLDLCCRKQGVSPRCQAMCNFDTFNDKSLVNAFLTAQCPGPELGKAFDCASTKVDHSECCTRGGLATFNGGRCLSFCQTNRNTPPNVFDYLPCLQVFDTIRNCYRDYQVGHKNLFGD